MPLLTEQQILSELSNLENWEKVDNTITKNFKTKNYVYTIGFVNQIALLAERADHHPDLIVKYNNVTVTLSTHSAGGITEKDIDLAREIEHL